MARTQDTVRIAIDDIDERLERGFLELDRARADGIGELAQINDARLRGLERDHKRLTEKLGEKHPRVVALSRFLEQGKSFSDELRLEQAAAAAPPIDVDARSWLLRGRVLDARRRPQKGLTIALFQDDQPLRHLGVATTDGDGLFALKVVRLEGVPREVSLRVLRGERLVHIADAPVAIRPGHSDFSEIVLGDGPPSPAPKRGPDDSRPPDHR